MWEDINPLDTVNSKEQHLKSRVLHMQNMDIENLTANQVNLNLDGKVYNAND